MGNKYSLFSGLFGKTRQRVLALLYERADTSFYTRQIFDAVNIGRGTVQRELQNLTDAGIILREVQGRQVYYRANRENPVFNELKSLMMKTGRLTAGQAQPGELLLGGRFNISARKLAQFCRRNFIKKLSLFGSVLRKDFRPESDIDILVEFELGHVPGFAIVDMEKELSSLLGHKVDMRTPGDLSRYFRDKVMKEAKVEYEYVRK